MFQTRHRRRRHLALRIATPAVLIFLIWLVGLFWFAAELPHRVSDPDRPTDAIVVLTGGSGRLTQGLELLSQGRAQKLFVSGVYRGVDITELFRVRRESPDEFQCCVTLGHEADDTRGNAVETAAWMREQGFASLRLVTANYHMPRSLIEFRHALPEPGSATLLATEYSKYLVAWPRTAVSGAGR
jgi:uncharacterized SAM-binding protein YcdF (DUF218 family)